MRSRNVIVVLLAILIPVFACSTSPYEKKKSSASNDAVCSTCHGSAENAAPPRDTLGRTSTSERSIGAHQTHLLGSDISAPLDCTDCHVVPTSPTDEGHIDSDGVAEVTFGSLALTESASPNWNGVTCAGTYCHGSTLSGGSNNEPNWTTVDSTQAACGTCHGLPPAAPHPRSENCEMCHSQVAGPNQTIISPELHINGTVDVDSNLACSSCHGSETNAAPPQDTEGRTSTIERTIGAHQSHVVGTSIASPIACSACHIEPATISAVGHIDDSPGAEIVFGSLASSDGSSPTWNGTTCAGTYCHGASLSGGVNQAPNWTTVNGSQSACGTCHGIPPSSPHLARTDCETCHGDVVSAGFVISNPALHVNGVVNVTANLPCNTCHGSATNDAPPTDTSGNSSTGLRSVGMHQAHVMGTNSHAAIPCTECHVVPVSWEDIGHMDEDGVAEVAFGPMASHNGWVYDSFFDEVATDPRNPVWNTTTCADTYCHNPQDLDVSTDKIFAPTWTATFPAGPDRCARCHGYPPASHDPGWTSCGSCHSSVIGPDHRTFIDPAKHVNGLLLE